MFGYVTVCEPELKIKDFRKYRSYYCGLCQTLKEKYGFSGQMTLTYDMTFAILLLTSLYECESRIEQHRCKVHPVKKQTMRRNEMTEYAADMNLLLAYYHLEDDWADEKKAAAFFGKGVLKRKACFIIEEYPRQSRIIQKTLRAIRKCEKENCTDLDRISGYFGRMMEELFVYRKDVWEKTLRKIGFFLGKFIYLMDAYDDLKKDARHGSFNALAATKQAFGSDSAGFEARCHELLTQQMALCAQNFELLPILKDTPEGQLLHNTIYAGVWSKYALVKATRTPRKGKPNE